jgi:DNA-binding response OmpR family regulator
MGRKGKPCILVVEDERTMRDVVVAFLKAGGYDNVVTAGNAEEAAFHLFKDKDLNIRLAIVDLVLPNASGLTLIRNLRNAKAAWRRALPVIVLTGRTDTETYKMAARRGIQAYLIKPISAELLVATVKKIMAPASPPPPEPTTPAAA